MVLPVAGGMLVVREAMFISGGGFSAGKISVFSSSFAVSLIE
jgi:hypothetical protein